MVVAGFAFPSSSSLSEMVGFEVAGFFVLRCFLAFCVDGPGADIRFVLFCFV
jgi:hypothetical protein